MLFFPLPGPVMVTILLHTSQLLILAGGALAGANLDGQFDHYQETSLFTDEKLCTPQNIAVRHVLIAQCRNLYSLSYKKKRKFGASYIKNMNQLICKFLGIELFKSIYKSKYRSVQDCFLYQFL